MSGRRMRRPLRQDGVLLYCVSRVDMEMSFGRHTRLARARVIFPFSDIIYDVRSAVVLRSYNANLEYASCYADATAVVS